MGIVLFDFPYGFLNNGRKSGRNDGKIKILTQLTVSDIFDFDFFANCNIVKHNFRDLKYSLNMHLFRYNRTFNIL